jgi:hypothetical protein
MRFILKTMEAPAVVLDSSTFSYREFNGHPYWVAAKVLLNNWTMANTNYGEVNMGVVVSPENDNGTYFMRLDQFNFFLRTGARAVLHLPHLRMD